MILEYFQNNNGRWFLCCNKTHFVYFYNLDLETGRYTTSNEEDQLDQLHGLKIKILEY